MADKREQLDQRHTALKAERVKWEPDWREIAEQLIPYRTSWDPANSFTDAGRRKNNHILNSLPIFALQTLEAGLMAGVTSPARDWFAMHTSDKDLNDKQEVRVWLDLVTDIIKGALRRGKLYGALANGVYADLGSIGTASMFAEEGRPGQLRFTSIPVGEYWIDVDADGVVDVIIREMPRTVRQVVNKFGLENCSKQTQDAWENNHLSNPILVKHAVVPNEEFQDGVIGPRGMRWSSSWYETFNEDRKQFLRLGGYEEFPAMVPRWRRRSGDVYGRGPGSVVRGDCRGLQHKEGRVLRMFDKATDPAMKGTTGISRPSLLPGDMTFIPAGQGTIFEPVHDINPQAIVVAEKFIDRDEQRINRAMHADLWRSILDDTRNQRATATEIEARRLEVMLQLGPVLENLDDELLEPIVMRAFHVLRRNDMLPPPPEEAIGIPMKVEFISVMHQMQQATGLAGMRTMIGEVLQLIEVWPEAGDKIDIDIAVDEFARITGVRPDLVRDEDDVDEIRAEKAAMEEREQLGEGASALAEGIKNVGQADPQNLQAIAKQFGPVVAAQGGALGPITE